LRQVEKQAMPNVHLLVLGNKCDVADELRNVPTAEAETFCKNKNVDFLEVSAKEGKDVAAAFLGLSMKLSNVYPKVQRNTENNPIINEMAKKREELQLLSAAVSQKGERKCC
jgi:GTPase SAR1 family protein